MEQSELYTQLSNVNAELRKLRSELHLCNVISRDELEIERKLELELYRENTHKEKSNSLPYLRG